MARDPRVDAYIAEQAEFARPILRWLRERVHAACPQVEETIKWGRPGFYYRGRPLVGLAAFKAHAVFGLWDPQAAAPASAGSDIPERLTSMADLPPAADVEATIRAAVARLDSGVKTIRPRAAPKGEPDVPELLAEALARDDAAAATFNGFPPGQRREYCEWVAEAKRPETRDKRIAQTIEWLREGKRRNWKYENC